MTQPWALPAQKAKRVLGCIQSTVGSRGGRGFCPSALVRPHLESCIRQEGQGAAGVSPEETIKMIRLTEHFFYEERLRELELFTLEKKRVQNDVIAASQYLKRAYRKDGERLFTRACSDRRNGFKLQDWTFKLDMRKILFTVSMVRHWNRLPRELVGAPSLAEFKTRLDGALSSLVW
ncbi:hypothetical protein HGM15179_016893 [Zosterops borbonicus]|uniref:Uncharacterized protein n=1 Tax=Zosterops borbonicus TaxID=364589 RepID=A0A8K1G1T3_9PASS|nr:hypothetical protein HGM15179_016893 [Zosterops borbonicus]